MTSHPAWLESRLGVADPEHVARHTRAVRLIFLRRYAAKLEYELELHAEGARLDAMPARYSQLLGDATAVAWPRANWLADVDPAFYVACYLRAWALEAIWRRALHGAFRRELVRRAGGGGVAARPVAQRPAPARRRAPRRDARRGAGLHGARGGVRRLGRARGRGLSLSRAACRSRRRSPCGPCCGARRCARAAARPS